MKRIMLMAILSTTLVSCKESVEDVDKKVVARWNALIGSDYESAYEYLAPSVRNLEKLSSYSLRMETAKLNTKWKSAEFVSKDCDEVQCEVKVSVKYVYSFPRRSMGTSEMVTVLTENWINKSDVWYHMPKSQ